MLENMSKWMLARGVPRSIVVLIVGILYYPVTYLTRKNLSEFFYGSIVMAWMVLCILSALSVAINFLHLGGSHSEYFNSHDFNMGLVGLVIAFLIAMMAFGMDEAEKIVPASRKEKDDSNE